MNVNEFLLVSLLAFGGAAYAHEGPPLNELCKAECPQAKDEAEATKCMDGLAVKKKDDRKFRKTDCFAAYKDHKAHSKEDSHGH